MLSTLTGSDGFIVLEEDRQFVRWGEPVVPMQGICPRPIDSAFLGTVVHLQFASGTEPVHADACQPQDRPEPSTVNPCASNKGLVLPDLMYSRKAGASGCVAVAVSAIG
jgi:hypothetical protein